MYAAIESDGELYKMQQEAIRRARETARRSMDYGAGPSRPDSAPAPQYISDPQPRTRRLRSICRRPKRCARRRPQKRNGLLRRPDFIDRVGMDNLLILAVLVILLMDECSDTLLLIALAYLLLSDKF